MTIGIDFDTLHTHSRLPADGALRTVPCPGALDALRHLMTTEPVYIHTHRDIDQVAEWLIGHDFTVRLTCDRPTWDITGHLLVTNRIQDARAYLDRRAIRFESWPQALTDLAPDTTKPTADGELAEAHATIARIRKLAHEMRDWASPQGIATVYAARILDELDRT